MRHVMEVFRMFGFLTILGVLLAALSGAGCEGSGGGTAAYEFPASR